VTDATRETRLLETFVTLADTLVAGYDMADLLQTLVDRSRELSGSDAAGILLRTPSQQLQIVASSDDTPALLETMQLAAESGPCVQCVREGRPVTVSDLGSVEQWPELRAAALRQGFRSLHAIPLRLRETTIGAMNLFREAPGELPEPDAVAAQALADVATIGILQERAVHEADVARGQLQRALDSRVTIEQAKGVIAYRHGLDMAAAFDSIRDYARSNRLGISAVAEQIVQRTLSL
jgi:GAF domain-containing protein